jgi:hypothetical protein
MLMNLAGPHGGPPVQFVRQLGAARGGVPTLPALGVTRLAEASRAPQESAGVPDWASHWPIPSHRPSPSDLHRVRSRRGRDRGCKASPVLLKTKGILTGQQQALHHDRRDVAGDAWSGAGRGAGQQCGCATQVRARHGVVCAQRAASRQPWEGVAPVTAMVDFGASRSAGPSGTAASWLRTIVGAATLLSWAVYLRERRP